MVRESWNHQKMHRLDGRENSNTSIKGNFEAKVSIFMCIFVKRVKLLWAISLSLFSYKIWLQVDCIYLH
ncbi:hypothetical protein AQUCO_01300746v1 [Aquilegia coerulea]|uniref:Uncharacterized protein n=1 Tax=Aquilegia coerulea TaxID=218851 RepID=A0A2G5E389_AQUCA|nr:hypothetical protein AQUCO_01300746v1 [Aquilegia coerulea]